MNDTDIDSVRSEAARWLAAEPDGDIRSELEALMAGPDDQLLARFRGRLQFGTAGLRAAVGAGPRRMNRLVVRQTAAGLARYLLDTDPNVRQRGVVIGYDARRKSDVFADDTARVMAAFGIPSKLFDQTVPTPVLAWSIVPLGCAAGIVVTASHNPPADNGYKVYLADGAQIVPPHDAGISAQIEAVDPTEVPIEPSDHPLISMLGDAQIEAYVESVPAVRYQPELDGVTVAYTAMHGVGGAVLMSAFKAAGLPEPVVVADQFEPDGTFPTVSFPNPEEPGAMDLLIEVASASGAAVAIANDPDADRLGAAIPQPDGTWRRLGGDEIGWLFADYILAHTEGADRFVITTLVSSSLLGKMAEDHGVHATETFTGFKWIAKAVLQHPEREFLLGYEQALGYLVAKAPLDKDGISAAVLFAEMAADAAARGRTIQGWLDEIADRYGRHILAEKSVKMPPPEGAAKVAAMRADPPSVIGGREVLDTTDYPEANLLRFSLRGNVRIQVRPSGTEPKVKIYGEGVDEDPTALVDALAELLG